MQFDKRVKLYCNCKSAKHQFCFRLQGKILIYFLKEHKKAFSEIKDQRISHKITARKHI